MRTGALLLILAVNAAATGTSHFRFTRPVNTPPAPGQTCVALDAKIFSHAASGLADVRLFNGGAEIPYAIRTAAPAQSAQTSLAPLNLGTRNGQTSFDLAMPPGMYGDLQLSVSAQNFIASVTVSGSQTENPAGHTLLGTFTIFDLTAQKLGRSTVLHLPASNFRYLHLSIGAPLRPEQIGSASTVSAPLSEALYEEVAGTSLIRQRGSTSVVEFSVPANVPVDRVHFIAAAKPANFTRDVTVTVKPEVRTPRSDYEPPQPVSFTGNLLRLHRVEDGRRIDEERMVVDTSGQTFAEPATWIVTVENGNDVPLALSSVRLEMRQRELCFEAGATGQYVLYYGDSTLENPRYDYATLFTPEKNAVRESTGAEQPNPAYQPRPDDRPFTERHPVLLWIALLGTMLALGAVVFRSVSENKPPN
ncbi:MAG TPA: DUF3999 family protein [Acidobacteriaceae bacterium]|nr:DUF3999 family protein [Acidobacteriaceae bacterium]